MQKMILMLSAAVLLVFTSLPVRADMGHIAQTTYSDREFLSGMIAHHEGAVVMAEELLKSPKNELDEQTSQWARDILAVQGREIEEMKKLLEPLGGIDRTAFEHMEKGMHAMMHMLNQNKNPNIRFVEQMIPHHAQALDMSVPALVHSRDAKIMLLAEQIIIAQTKEIYAFRVWLDSYMQTDE